MTKLGKIKSQELIYKSKKEVENKVLYMEKGGRAETID